jgi:hypothetical protein
MLDVPQFAAEKEKRSGDAFIHLLEIEYAPGQFVRYARYNEPVTFEGLIWSPFPMSKPTRSEASSGEIPAKDIMVSGVGREIASILEFFDIEGRPGRTIRVHPSQLGDPTAKIVSKFIVRSARVQANNAIITVTPLTIDPLTTFVPRRRVSATEFPGILGAGFRFR